MHGTDCGRLAGKVALITGAAGGIGRATAELFAREGARLALADVEGDAAADLAARLVEAEGAESGTATGAATGTEALGLALDVTSEERWGEVLDLVERRFGRLDVLVNVAGVVDWPGIEDTGREAWDRVIAVNQTGTWLGMKTALPLLRASGNASVINTSSVLGLVGSGAAAAYQASKGAVRLLTKTAAVEYATRGVRVNSVHPGVVATPMIQDLLDAEGDAQPDVARTPMRRAGRPGEIAPVMLFLAGDESSFVTGAEFVVDGGLTAH
ncbi:glucose 1-dehydrogenase [Streptomyces albiaxialis]|uniref:Glucose 1-dehydrogenase n=1 Tax=Streptomyces albiaxialis TaxID=329523 RepID=A0ABP5I4U4_9ACTN